MCRAVLHRALVALCVVLLLSCLSPVVALSFQGPGATRHQIDSRAGVPAFKFGYRPGFNPSPRGETTIYGDGTVQVKGRSPKTVRTLHLPLAKLRSLLRFAESKGFFRLPAHITAREPMPDSSAAYISIHTTSVDKTVSKDFGAHNAAFDQVFAKLSVTVGQAR